VRGGREGSQKVRGERWKVMGRVLAMFEARRKFFAGLRRCLANRPCVDVSRLKPRRLLPSERLFPMFHAVLDVST
jgi:hypothetical protein